jgi:DNA invertase Pin-like site-specific DNA recombinase
MQRWSAIDDITIHMSDLPDPESTARATTVLLLTARGVPLLAQRQRLRALAGQLRLGVGGEVVFRRRRRGGLGEQLRAALLPAGVAVVVVEQLVTLARDPLSALLIASEIRTMGLALVSASEPWLSDLGPALPALGAWLTASRQNQRSEAARAALGRARAEGRRVGRPRAKIDLTIALPLATRVGVERAAVQLGVGASTLRRAIAGARAALPVASLSSHLDLGGLQ